MKNFAVNVTAYATVLVTAESLEDALDMASDQTDVGDLTVDEVSLIREVPESDYDDEARHAELVVTPD